MTRVSLYNGVLDRNGVEVAMDAVFNRIRTAEKGLAEKTRLLNVLAQTDPETYTREKMKLPAVTWSGIFQQRKTLITHSGYIVLDFDHIDIGTLLSDFAKHRNVFFAFVSPSGSGVKAIVPVAPSPTHHRTIKSLLGRSVTFLTSSVR